MACLSGVGLNLASVPVVSLSKKLYTGGFKEGIPGPVFTKLLRIKLEQ